MLQIGSQELAEDLLFSMLGQIQGAGLQEDLSLFDGQEIDTWNIASPTKNNSEC